LVKIAIVVSFGLMLPRCPARCPLPGAVLYTVGNCPAEPSLPRGILAVEKLVKGHEATHFETKGTGDPSETGVRLSDGVMFHLLDYGAFEHQYSSTIRPI
jgi:hypothetical protein